MHGAHVAISHLTEPGLLHAAKGVARAGAVPLSFGAKWAEAIQAGAVAAPQKKIEAVPVAAKKPGSKAEPEAADGVAEPVKDLQEPVVENAHVPAALVSTNGLVETDAPKKSAAPADKTLAAETKKHKAVDTQIEAMPQVATTVSAETAVMTPAPMPVADQNAMQTANMMRDGKPVANVDEVAGKRDRAAVMKGDGVAKGDGSAKANAVEAKSIAAAEADKTPAVFDVNGIHIDGQAVFANHANAVAIHGNDANVGAVQASVAAVAPALLHRGEGSSARVLGDVQHSSPIANAGGSAVQGLAAGPGQLEVGVLDGTHGWLKIRAEIGTDGSVSALLTSNATAHEGLKETVPAMAGYLESESLNVGSIAVHPCGGNLRRGD